MSAYDATRDTLLVTRIAAGDTAAFRVVYDDHAAALWRHASRILGDRDLAEDMVHEVYTTLWTRRASLAITTSLRAYLFAMVRHRAFMVLRHNAVIARVAQPIERHTQTTTGFAEGQNIPVPSSSPAPDVLVYETQLHEVVRRAVDELPERQRAALELRWLHGLGHTETAEVLGISEAAVRKLIDKALGRLDTLRRLLHEGE